MPTILITGANRGIGHGLASRFLVRPDTTLIACVRSPSHSTSLSLNDLPRGTNSSLIVLPYDASSSTSASEAVTTLKSSYNVQKLDIVIANAGGISYAGASIDASSEDMLSHFQINAIAPVLLFKAVLPFLQASSSGDSGSKPKFIPVSSAVGSHARLHTFPPGGVMPYGAAKCALNFAFRKMAVEHPDVTILMLTPGPVMTGFGDGVFPPGVKESLRARSVPFDDSVKGLVKEIDSAGNEDGGKSGEFRAWNGEVVDW